MEKMELVMFQMKKQMKEKGITQNDIAKALDISIVTVNHVLNLKAGTLDTIRKVINYIENK